MALYLHEARPRLVHDSMETAFFLSRAGNRVSRSLIHAMMRNYGQDAGVFLVAATGGDVGLDSYYGLDVIIDGFGVEFDGAEHIAVVRYGNGVHAFFFAPLEKLIEAYRAVEQ